MFPASTKGGGTCMVPGPTDVCKVPAPPAPPIPTPLPNIGMCMQANGASTKVKISGSFALTVSSKIPMSTGDEPGVLGGMISNTFKQQVAYKKGSGKVKIQGKGAVYATGITGHNGSNANMPAGFQTGPSQVKVIVAG
ncbi:hypothetical protein PLCT1_00212 [Planctomycetaceae bacterium]|nr:hypothetical protein PLCT1_00212 [Planctomycetaceae bacterium]